MFNFKSAARIVFCVALMQQTVSNASCINERNLKKKTGREQITI